MPDTARHYGLTVNAQEDERLDPLKATIAAAAYLRELYSRFQDWPLTFAAYNAGENRVQQAMDRLGTRDFWALSRDLALPEETRRYVAKVISATRGGFSDPSRGSNQIDSIFSAGGRMLTSDNNPSVKSHILFAIVSPETAARTDREITFVTGRFAEDRIKSNPKAPAHGVEMQTASHNHKE